MTQRELDAAAAAVRRYVDSTGYGNFIDNQICIDVAAAALKAAEAERKSQGAR